MKASIPLAAVVAVACISALAQEAPRLESSSGAGSASQAPIAAAAAVDARPVKLRYIELMKLSPEARASAIDIAPSDERDRFLASLSGERRAVMAVDPEDCGTFARAKRVALATGKVDDGILSDTAQDFGNSAAVGLLNHFAGGIGSVLVGAAKVNELGKLAGSIGDYQDVCDLSPEDRTALLAPASETLKTAAAAAPREDSALDKLSRFFAK